MDSVRIRPAQHPALLWMFVRSLGRQIVANTDVRIFLLETYAVVYSFTASAFHTDKPVIADDPLALVKLALPVITVLAVLLLRNAWAARERHQLAPVVDVSLAFGLVILLQVALSAHYPSLELPRWRATQGSWAGWLFLTELRAMFPVYLRPFRQATDAMPAMHIDEIRWRTEELQRQLRQRNTWAYSATTVILVLFGVCLARTNEVTARIGSALIVAGALHIILQVRRHGAPRSGPGADGFEVFREFCQSELDRQHRLLSLVRYSYIGLLIPGLLLVLAGSDVYSYVVVMYVLLIAELIYREILRLRHEHGEITLAAEVSAAAC